jgi:hypothetical protein
LNSSLQILSHTAHYITKKQKNQHAAASPILEPQQAVKRISSLAARTNEEKMKKPHNRFIGGVIWRNRSGKGKRGSGSVAPEACPLIRPQKPCPPGR